MIRIYHVILLFPILMCVLLYLVFVFWLNAGALVSELGPVVMCVAAAVAACMAALTIHNQNLIQRKSVALDGIRFLSAREFNKEYMNQRAQFLSLCSEDGCLSASLANDLQNNEALPSIRAILNEYECIALGIRVGIIDEKLFKYYMRGTLIKDWDRSRDFVSALRQRVGNQALFSELEWLADRWCST